MMYKIPVSVLVVIHTQAWEVLILERSDRPGFWQSVTGSIDRVDEPLAQTARREVEEETGIDVRSGRLVDWEHSNRFEIYPHWRARYGPGVTVNVEHVFGLALPARVPVTISREHTRYAWLPWDEAAARVFSPTNVEAIRRLRMPTPPGIV
ncbi:MAG: dihydroneopterin triphosphate diphosphatase [Proteobacteria bacterium]|nr:dihydroneopterin triphosphate diphosphatase [Burkholderiales bacterium]